MKNKKDGALTYAEAYTELQQIVNQLQNESVRIDDLDNLVRRASELLAFCQEKLRKIEENVNANLETLE